MSAARIGVVLSAFMAGTCAAMDRSPRTEMPPIAAPTPAAVAIPPKDATATPLPVTTSQPPATPPPSPTTSAPSPPALPPKQESAEPAAATPKASPPLDLDALETRLKETKAIGLFTKLTLKNQIDDLLDRFRAFHQSHPKASLAELRQSFDLLVLKVLALLQDSDPPLASAIASSRESIWGILSNPARFAAT